MKTTASSPKKQFEVIFTRLRNGFKKKGRAQFRHRWYLVSLLSKT